MEKEGNRKGLSTVIVTLIFVLLSLVAVGIIWVVIRNLIINQSEGISFDKLSVSLDIKKAYSIGENNVSVQVKRNVGGGDLTGIKFIFYTENDNEIVSENIPISELETRTFTFFLEKINVSKITKIAVLPVFQTGISDTVSDTYTIKNITSGEETPCIPICTGKNCGTDGCGGTCGTCGTGEYCNASGNCIATSSCVPTNCSTQGYQCGSGIANGTCSGTLNCGTCSSEYYCNSSYRCVFNGTSCTPQTCSALGYQCGIWSNGTCGGTLNCGTCGTGYTCNVSGRCVSSCFPTSCSAQGYQCGIWSNGTCGGTLNCGTCGTGYTCNVSGACQPTSTLCSNLRLLMHFDSSGITTLDSSGNGNNGYVNGSTWTSSGRFGGAFNYDRINDYIDAGNSNTLNLNESFTVSTWVNVYNNPTVGIIISRAKENYWLATGENGYLLYARNSSGNITFRTELVGNLSSREILWDVPILFNKWYHVAVVKNLTSISFYVAGIRRGLSNVNLGDVSTPNEYLYIGKARTATNQFFNGTIDEVAIWGRSLTDTEVLNLNNSGSAISC